MAWKNVKLCLLSVKNVELGVHREEYGEYRMDNAEERKGHQVYDDSTSLG